jgi:hypothetical protein
MPILRCKRVRFYSQGDERAFFDFAGNIKSISKIKGVGEEIQLKVASRVSDTSLRDLVGLFQRYHIRMNQLRQFATSRNHHWFHDRRAFWFAKVFGK